MRTKDIAPGTTYAVNSSTVKTEDMKHATAAEVVEVRGPREVLALIQTFDGPQTWVYRSGDIRMTWDEWEAR